MLVRIWNKHNLRDSFVNRAVKIFDSARFLAHIKQYCQLNVNPETLFLGPYKI